MLAPLSTTSSNNVDVQWAATTRDHDATGKRVHNGWTLNGQTYVTAMAHDVSGVAPPQKHS